VIPATNSAVDVVQPSTNAPANATPSAATNAPDIAPPAPPVTMNPPAMVPPGILGAQQKQEEIADIRPPFFFLHSWLWLWIALAIIALIALLIALWFWLRSPRVLSPKTAYEQTLEKLERARALLKVEDPMPYAVFVSETIRTYLGQRFQSPSTRRTTEEFLKVMESDHHTPLAEHRDLLRSFLVSCDLVKFARYQPTLEELEQVQQRAYNFVTATKPVAPTPGQKPGATP
jgi:hypothetical protein